MDQIPRWYVGLHDCQHINTRAKKQKVEQGKKMNVRLVTLVEERSRDVTCAVAEEEHGISYNFLGMT